MGVKLCPLHIHSMVDIQHQFIMHLVDNEFMVLEVVIPPLFPSHKHLHTEFRYTVFLLGTSSNLKESSRFNIARTQVLSKLLMVPTTIFLIHHFPSI